MARAAIENKDVRELQELARDSVRAPLPRRKKRRSRAAYLELIDILSRWSGAGLALVAGVGIYLAITAGRAYPARAAVWTVMLIAALWVCRRMRGQFRAGAAIAAKPFRWRATYTSGLTVLGVIFASAPILLTPFGAPQALALQVLALGMIASFGAALFHSAHLPSAAALALPGAILPILAALRAGDGLIPLTVAGLSILALTGLFAFSGVLTELVSRRHPRTTFLRSEVETSDGLDVRYQPGQTAQNAV